MRGGIEENHSITTPAWSIKREDGMMHRKIILAECRKEVEKEELEADQRGNAAHIQSLQAQITQLKKKLRDKERGDEVVITRLFKNDEKLIVEHKDKTIQSVLEILDQKLFEMSKRSDLIQHEFKRKEYNLKEKREELASLTSVCCENTPHNASVQWLQRLENRSQKIQLKTDEANYILDQYTKINEMLLQERKHFQKKLKWVDDALEGQATDIASLRENRSGAKAFGAAARAQMSHYSAHSAKTRSRNERVAQQFRAKANKQERKRKVAESRKLASRSDETVQSQQDSEAAVAFVEAFAKIKKSTGISSIQNLEGHCNHQIESGQQLRDLAKQSEGQLQTLHKEEESLRRETERLAQKLASDSNGDDQEKIRELEKSIEEESRNQKMVQEHSSYLDRVRTHVRNGLQQTCNVLDAHNNMTVGNSVLDPTTTELMESCQERLLFILKKLSSRDSLLQQVQISKLVPDILEVTEVKQSIEPAAAIPLRAPESDSSDEDKAIGRLYLKSQAERVAGHRSKQKSTKRQLLKL